MGVKWQEAQKDYGEGIMEEIEGTSKPDRNKHNLYTKISELISEIKLIIR